MTQHKQQRPLTKLAAIVLYLVLGVSLILLGLDTLAYPGFVFHHFSLHPVQIMAAALVLNFLIRLFHLPPAALRLLFKAGFITSLLIYLLMYWAENNFYTNVVFSTFHLHPDQFYFFHLFFLGLSLINIDLHQLKNNYRLALLTAPWILTAIGFALRYRFKQFFFTLLWEDGIVEYLTFLFSLVSGLISLKIAVLSRNRPSLFKQKQLNWLSTAIFTLLGLGLIFVAGEEISWGQRILQFNTPEALQQANLQNETNLHNHPIIFRYVYLGYTLICFYGSFAWVGLKTIKNLVSQSVFRLLRLLVPPYFLMFWFWLMPIYVRIRATQGLWSGTEFQEPGEMLMMFGILIWLVIDFGAISQGKIPFQTNSEVKT